MSILSGSSRISKSLKVWVKAFGRYRVSNIVPTRIDTDFDVLVAKVFPDLAEMEEKEESELVYQIKAHLFDKDSMRKRVLEVEQHYFGRILKMVSGSRRRATPKERQSVCE